MKKGLFSILAGALLVVGCQNYDDQFSNIESQITALASQVAGLSQVQSDLTTLAGTVNALQSNIGTTVDAALADGLADIDAAVVALEAATATAASSEDVAAIATAVAGQQDDLDDILASTSFFQGNVTINSIADLDTYHNARAGIKVVNGNVTINSNSEMDMVKVQEVVDAITQTSLDFAYTSGTGVTTEITFNNLTATRSLTLDQKGGYVLQNLAAATVVTLDDDSTADIIDLRGLTSVTSLNAGSFHFAKATELHLTKLPRYDTALSLRVDEGGVIDITALRDVDALGVSAVLDLTLDGPDNITISALSGDKAGSDLTLKNVVNATVNGYDGKVTLGDDVQNFTSDGLVDWAITGDDLVSVNVTGILDPNASIADTKGPAVVLKDQGDLETVTLAGKILSADVNTNGNLVTLTITAEVQDAISVATNSDLTTVALTGAKASGITFDSNSDLETLTIDLAIVAGTAASAVIDGTVVVTDNESLETLNVSTDKIETLTVTGNDDLTAVNFTGLATFGATGKPVVKIYDNDLEATKFTDTIDVTTSVNGGATDIGTINSGTSGMSTLKTYLTAVAADADSTANVYFDTVSSFISEAAAETTDKIYNTAVGGAQPDQIKVLVLTANSADAGSSAITAKRSVVLTGFGDGGDRVTIVANGATLVTDAAMTSVNQALNITNILTTAALSNADAAGVTLTAVPHGKPVITLTIAANTSAMENSTTVVSGSTFGRHVSDVFTVSVPGSRSATVSAVTEGTAKNLVTALYNEWIAQNVTSAASALVSKWDISSNVAAVAGTSADQLVFTAKDSGTSMIGSALTFTASIASASLSNVGYKIGNYADNTISASDNIARGGGIVVTLTADTSGDLLSEIGSPAKTFGAGAKTINVTSSGVVVAELVTTLNKTTSDSGLITAANVYAYDSRSDVVYPDEAIGAAASNAVSFSRVGWL
ncbi:hypothetical protein N9541_03270 [Flavobacteriaceae bacterium]|nr:hypothetical protein [Flavobacteriaceae bacterium]